MVPVTQLSTYGEQVILYSALSYTAAPHSFLSSFRVRVHLQVSPSGRSNSLTLGGCSVSGFCCFFSAHNRPIFDSRIRTTYDRWANNIFDHVLRHLAHGVVYRLYPPLQSKGYG